MIEKLHLYITIIAALIVNVCCIVMSNSLYISVLYIILTIIAFYIIGIFVRNFFIKNFYAKEETENTEDEQNPGDEVTETDGVEISEDTEEQLI